MRILLLCHSFNSLSQRIFVDLVEAGHEVSVELDVHDLVSIEAATVFCPDVIVAPFLRRALPADLWQKYLCLVVHPGPEGDRGPTSLDWAILEGRETWGVTLLQANAEMDAGPVWGTAEFPMRSASKSSIYRNEVTEAATRLIIGALKDLAKGKTTPPLPSTLKPLRTAIKRHNRTIDWSKDETKTVSRKLRSADGSPGITDEIYGQQWQIYGGCPEGILKGEPGTILAKAGDAVCRATIDGAIWLTHARASGAMSIKLPATIAWENYLREVPELPMSENHQPQTWQDIWYENSGNVGFLHFNFPNGAMSTRHCRRLLKAYRKALTQPTHILVLMGGTDFWSNGIHLHEIEAAASPGEESWENINAIDDLVSEIILTQDRLVVSALQGNAGAGGVFMALAADRVWARAGIVLNPHYKNMGNLYGSEYWTYLLPRRLDDPQAIFQRRLPLGATEAANLGLLDAVFPGSNAQFAATVRQTALSLAADPSWPQQIADKQCVRRKDEAKRALEEYRRDELEHMRRNFFGSDPSYHVARYNFVFRIPHSRTPLYLALHRQTR